MRYAIATEIYENSEQLKHNEIVRLQNECWQLLNTRIFTRPAIRQVGDLEPIAYNKNNFHQK